MSLLKRSFGLILIAVLSLGGHAFAATTGAIAITGGEQSVGGTLWDAGTLTVTVDGTYSVTIAYGQFSTVGSVASGLAAKISQDCNAPVRARANGAVISFKLRGSTSSVTSISVSTTYDSFNFAHSSFQGNATTLLTPSVDVTCAANPLIVESTTSCTAIVGGAATGTISFSVDGALWANVALTSGSATASNGLGNAAVGSHLVTAQYSGDGTYAQTSGTYSVVVATSQPTSGPIYSYSIPSSGGYAPSGNIVSYTDSVMGTWNLGYDGLNRLTSANSNTTILGNQYFCWGYDSFGNRTISAKSSSPCVSTPPQSLPTISYDVNNRVISTPVSPSLVNVYDAAGNVTDDGRNQYLYDGDGRICAVRFYLTGAMTQYLYNAEGRRVMKGSITSFSCGDNNGFVAQTEEILGPGGEQVTELGPTGNWLHTNVWSAGRLLATYGDDNQGVHFNLADWLGTKRAQVNYAGQIDHVCQSLPFGDDLSCSGTVDEATEHHFTGKERDAESGLDYFGARYYSSNVGRWMNPDWADKPEAVPYSSLDNPQSLNLYGYVLNNPLSKADPDGHAGCPPDCGDSTWPTSVASPAPSLWNRFVDANVSFLHTAAVLYSDLMNPTRNCPNCSIGIVPLGMPEGLAAKGVSAYEVGTYGELAPRSIGDGLAIDHIPSNASNIAREEAQLGRPLTAPERAVVRDQGTAVAVPSDLHQSTSPTFGGRNTPAQIQADAANPRAAAVRDTRTMVNAASASNKQAAQVAAQKICTAIGCQ
ncbi:RHS repeat-associated core domain-containing protein [Granulicella sp. dw_53]|uniref:RHS repeat-associated core domain-containing protein n=1 Tax=Granulicella sp. dw_53 TaxID=2719792 RepID=UPI001BD2E39D|nr:RHS repeat-associated core domain-containing protein [Granulicella sp. dw_53]